MVYLKLKPGEIWAFGSSYLKQNKTKKKNIFIMLWHAEWKLYWPLCYIFRITMIQVSFQVVTVPVDLKTHNPSLQTNIQNTSPICFNLCTQTANLGNQKKSSANYHFSYLNWQFSKVMRSLGFNHIYYLLQWEYRTVKSIQHWFIEAASFEKEVISCVFNVPSRSNQINQ